MVGALGHVVEISTLALVSNHVVEMTTIREKTSPICWTRPCEGEDRSIENMLCDL